MDPYCTVDSSEGEGRYAKCYSRIDQPHFTRYYARFLDSPTENTLNVICRMYQSWTLCFQSWAAECQIQLAIILENIPHTQQRLSHICIQNRDAVLNSMGCLLTQRADHNVLFRGCSDLMTLRIQSKLYDTCSVVTDYVQCEDQLVRSACGSIIADFRLTVTLETHFAKYSKSHKCLYEPTSNMRGFTYSISCPPEFPIVVRDCIRRFQHHRLIMNHKLLAVVKSTDQEYTHFCRSYNEYRKCVSVVSTLCPRGLEEVYTSATEWKHSVAVGQYLCDTVYNDYHNLWPCFRKLVHLDFPRWCKQVYDTRPTRVKAFTLKCTSHRQHSATQIEKRDKLIQCYGSFIEQRCGTNSSLVISPLLHIQYSFDFLPPCYTTSNDVKTCIADSVMSHSQLDRTSGCVYSALLCLFVFDLIQFNFAHNNH